MYNFPISPSSPNPVALRVPRSSQSSDEFPSSGAEPVSRRLRAHTRSSAGRRWAAIRHEPGSTRTYASQPVCCCHQQRRNGSTATGNETREPVPFWYTFRPLSASPCRSPPARVHPLETWVDPEIGARAPRFRLTETPAPPLERARSRRVPPAPRPFR